ncbi:hypothetical protein PoB_001258000 [Plakobranchus ocellatus]|uniref:Uncharacterized protein n=1 Tax=Plakobranchus ocellatus TaxID=259542 RepID=A0AAV3YSE7_9GAST|nr:hypothetical protein PoB_001258000 [Plakobranchus ocellatus]
MTPKNLASSFTLHRDRLAVQMKGGLNVDSLSVEMDTGGLRDRESETVLGDPLLNLIYTQLSGALKMLQVFSLSVNGKSSTNKEAFTCLETD